MRLNHLALLNDGLLGWSCDAPCVGGGEGELAAHVEFDFARQLDDGFGVMAVLEQRVFDGLRAVDEQAAIETVLFLGDPLAALFLPMKTMADGELHDGGSTSFTLVFLLVASSASSRSHDRIRRCVVCANVRMAAWPGDGLTHAANIFPAGYEFEGDGTAIS